MKSVQNIIRSKCKKGCFNTIFEHCDNDAWHKIEHVRWEVKRNVMYSQMYYFNVTCQKT